MALEFTRSPEEIRQQLVEVAKQHGFTRFNRWIGAVVDIFSETYSDIYNQTYSLDSQTRLDTASGTYLDGYGTLLRQPRNSGQILQDLSFDNVYIRTSNGNPITLYNPGGVPLEINAGTRILDSNGNVILTTVDRLMMDGSQHYIRVVGVSPDQSTIPAGTYDISIGFLPSSLRKGNSESGSNLNILVPTLDVVVSRPIVGETSPISDDDYRSVLFSASRSRNKTNKEKVQTLLGNPNLAKTIVKEFTSGSSSFSVYAEPTISTLSKPLEMQLRNQLATIVPFGTVVHVARMIGSVVYAEIEITVTNITPASERNNVRDAAVSNAVKHILELQSGNQLNKLQLTNDIQKTSGVQTVKLKMLKVRGIRVNEDIYTMKDIEYLYATDNTISIKVL